MLISGNLVIVLIEILVSDKEGNETDLTGVYGQVRHAALFIPFIEVCMNSSLCAGTYFGSVARCFAGSGMGPMGLHGFYVRRAGCIPETSLNTEKK
jgi:hypothetical protein